MWQSGHTNFRLTQKCVGQGKPHRMHSAIYTTFLLSLGLSNWPYVISQYAVWELCKNMLARTRYILCSVIPVVNVYICGEWAIGRCRDSKPGPWIQSLTLLCHLATPVFTPSNAVQGRKMIGALRVFLGDNASRVYSLIMSRSALLAVYCTQLYCFVAMFKICCMPL